MALIPSFNPAAEPDGPSGYFIGRICPSHGQEEGSIPSLDTSFLFAGGKEEEDKEDEGRGSRKRPGSGGKDDALDGSSVGAEMGSQPFDPLKICKAMMSVCEGEGESALYVRK